MSLSSLMVHTCDIGRQSADRSETAGTVITWPLRAIDVPCRREPLKTEVRDAYGRLGHSVTHRFFFDTDQNFKVNIDRIVFEGYAYVVRVVDEFCAADSTPFLWTIAAEDKGVIETNGS